MSGGDITEEEHEVDLTADRGRRRQGGRAGRASPRERDTVTETSR